jgi:hypothetical protein
MRIALLIVSFTIIRLIGFSQINLVLNPSFESYNQCPTNINQTQYCNNWRSVDSVGFAQADFFDTCSATMQVPVPSLFPLFNQMPLSGGGVMGITTFYNFSLPELRTYLFGKLSNKLVANHQYESSFYINLMEFNMFACNGIGVYISSSSLDTISVGTQPLTYITPLVYSPIVNDTINWHKVSTVYTAIGNESRIMLGNFFTDSATSYVISNPNSIYPFSNYLIDDVSVIDCSTFPFAGNDTTISLGDSVYLGRNYEPIHIYNWFKNGFLIDTNIGFWAKPTQPTQYVLEQKLCGTLKYDTVFVNVSGNVGLAPPTKAEGAFKLVPNPNNGSFSIHYKLGNLSSANLNIFDNFGSIVYNTNITKEITAIDISSFAKGIYTLQMITNNGIYYEKLVKN